MRVCSLEGCDKPHRARGLCSTHYNSSRGYTKHHAQINRECAGCGKPIVRDLRYQHSPAHCSELCRQWSSFGAWSTTLPMYHISRWAGRTCTVRVPTEHQCESCGCVYTTTRSKQRFCTRTCKQKQSRSNRRASERNAHGTHSRKDVLKLWLTFDEQCAYCQQPTPEALIQADHVRSLARGGTNDISNILPACPSCNADKRELALDEWAKDRTRRGLPPVTTTWHTKDFRYTHLTEQTSVRMSHLLA